MPVGVDACDSGAASVVGDPRETGYPRKGRRNPRRRRRKVKEPHRPRRHDLNLKVRDKGEPFLGRDGLVEYARHPLKPAEWIHIVRHDGEMDLLQHTHLERALENARFKKRAEAKLCEREREGECNHNDVLVRGCRTHWQTLMTTAGTSIGG